jgi:hypothetical protein
MVSAAALPAASLWQAGPRNIYRNFDRPMSIQGAGHRNITLMERCYGALHLHNFFRGAYLYKYYRCSAPDLQ